MPIRSVFSSPPVRWYDLTPIDPPAQDQQTDITIGFGPIRFPDYLKRPQIVTRSSGSAVELADFDRWLEPIDAALPRTVGVNLDSLLESVRVIQFPFGSGLVDVDFRLVGQVIRFDLDADATAVFDVQWAILTADGERVSGPHRSHYKERAGSADFASKVSALNRTVNAWSRDIAEAFRTSTGD